VKLTDDEIAQRAKEHAARVEAAAQKGGCPKCGSMAIFNAKDPLDARLVLCHHCGNKFDSKTALSPGHGGAKKEED
jgi:hypothetical protein